MTLNEAGKNLRFNRQTIKRKIKLGEIQASMINRRWEITNESLNNYINKYANSDIV